MPDIYQFSIPIGWEDLPDKLAFAEEHQMGVEIAAFASGRALSDPVERAKMEHGFLAALQDFSGRRSYHGAFIDLGLHSEDPAIAAISRGRIQTDMGTAMQLGCRKVIFHTGFNPLVPVSLYEDQFIERHAAFWPAVADQWPGVTICLENMWESSPHLWGRLLRRIDHPQVAMCLDVAHAHAYGDFAVDAWMDHLKGQIVHMHWNDNHGDKDSHLAIGDGNLPWNKVIARTRSLEEATTVVLELSSLGAIRQSVRHLSQLNIPNLPRKVAGPAAADGQLRCDPRGMHR